MTNKTPEQEARTTIDKLLNSAGWDVQNIDSVNIFAHRGVAIREFPLNTGHGFADYLLYVDGKAAGVIEAKKTGTTLSGVEIQSAKYSHGLPDSLPAWHRPLPFCYQSTGIETCFSNAFDPEPRSRSVFAFHRPETMSKWLTPENPIAENGIADLQTGFGKRATLRFWLQHMPPLVEKGLWPAQIKAIKNLELSLAQDRPRSLIQMATGSGKTFTAINFIYRLIKFADAKRILFLVDRGNLAKQTLKEFKQFVSPYNNFKFSEEYIVQRLTSSTLDTSARVCICTIQRLYSMLRGQVLAEEDEEQSVQGLETIYKEVPPIEYNPDFPIEMFDFIITDECHRSIYNLWRQVLEYCDAYLIGLTATPNKQTFGFFNKNLVMEYSHDEAVADNVNVNYDVYRIKTQITENGSIVDAGFYIDKRDKETRSVRWEQLDEAFDYSSNQLDQDVVAPDQIRTVIQTFRDKLFTEIFPNRKEVPKTLIFAKDDSHAEDIVKIVREEFGKGNDFAQKITYKTFGKKPEDLITEFRSSYFPRIAVTVDMIATGTDIKPLEIVMFMRMVKSRSFFDQMKGRGVRVINDDDLCAVTSDAKTKDHFIIVDAVGVCEQDKSDSRPMDRKKFVSFEKLLQAVSLGSTEPAVISSVAVRLSSINRKLTDKDQKAIKALNNGHPLKKLTADLVAALNPDHHIEKAKAMFPEAIEISEQQKKAAAVLVIQNAARPLLDPNLRNKLIELKKKNEQTIDHVSEDQLISAGFDANALGKAKGVIDSFKAFIEENKNEITALQIIYNRPYKTRLHTDELQELADTIRKPPHHLTEDKLWQAYAVLAKDKVRGVNARHILTDLVSLVRFALDQDNELVPFADRVNANFSAWLAQQANNGRRFTPDQEKWLDMIRDHIAGNHSIESDNFEYPPFIQNGGLGRFYETFGDDYLLVLDELNNHLVA